MYMILILLNEIYVAYVAKIIDLFYVLILYIEIKFATILMYNICIYRGVYDSYKEMCNMRC